jgi:hypothetical protein
LVKNKLTAELFFELPHLILTHGKSCFIHNDTSEMYNLIANRYNVKNLKYVEIPYIMLGISLIENSKYVSIVLGMVAEKFSDKFNLKYFQLPEGVEIPEIYVKMFWMPENDNYAPNKWMRKIINESYSEAKLHFLV